MKVAKYLRQYNREEDRLLYWIRMNGGDVAIASIILDSYAYVNKKFVDGYVLDHKLLEDTFEDHQKSVKEILDKHKKYNFKPSIWDKIKIWRWTQGQ